MGMVTAQRLPTRPPKVSLHVKISAVSKAVVDRHSTGRDRSQAMAAEELILLGAAAYSLVTGQVGLVEFQETVMQIGVPMTLPKASPPAPAAPPAPSKSKPYVPREDRRQERRAAQTHGRPAFLPPGGAT